MSTPQRELVEACEHGDLACVKRCMADCVAQGVDINDATNYYRQTPLMRACYYRQLETAKYLLECGADVLVHGRDGSTALHWAIHDKELNMELIRLLLANGADVLATDHEGKTALHMAVGRRFSREFAELLIEAGADPAASIKAGPRKGSNSLHVACRQENYDAVAFLLERGMNVNARDGKGRTPLHILMEERSKKALVLLLLRYGADLYARDNDGLSIVQSHLMGRAASPNTLKLLIKNGLDVIASDDPDRPFLHEMTRVFRNPLDSFDVLLERGCPINSRNKSGETPLHVVCSAGDRTSLKHAEFLLSRGAQDALVIENKDGYLPLHCAAKGIPTTKSTSENTKFLRLLLDAGADVNATTRDGLSPLALLLHFHPEHLINSESLRGFYTVYYDCVRLLCSHGAMWDDICELRLTLMTQVAQTLEEDGAFNTTGADQGEDPLYKEARAFLTAWKETSNDASHFNPLRLLSGMRACVQFWTYERTRCGNDTKLTNIPSEVYLQGEAAVHAWLKDMRTSTAAQLVSRSKICVVGPSEWGKTSLVKSLTLRELSLVHVDDRTVGIDLFSCAFQEEVRQNKEVHSGKPSPEDDRLTVPDTVAAEPKNHDGDFG